MNTIQTLETDYLRSNRTLETIKVFNHSRSKLLWLYNYEGWHFRVFESKQEVNDFFSNNTEPKISFDEEVQLDNFLLNMIL
jgi:hypothetical protein